MQTTYSGCRSRQSHRRIHITWLVATGILVVLPSTAIAQLPQIRLFSLFPAGGQVGSAVDVVVTGGADLDDVTGLLFSDPAITAVPKTAAAPGEKAPEANTFTVTIAPHAQPGTCDVRVAGHFGVSNPRSFEVDTRTELAETEPNDTIEHATLVELNSVINARSNTAADVDVYRFHGQQGQRVLAECRAASLDSRMLATIEAYDAHGHRLTTGHSKTGPDPMLDVTLPVDGDYFLKVVDGVYRGGNEYFYRLHLHNQPHIDFVMPPAGLAGSSGTYTLFGRNLPGGMTAGVASDGHALEKLNVQIALPSDDATLQLGGNVTSLQAGNDQITYALDANGTRSNPVPIHFAAAPATLEAEPNDTLDTAQQISVPVEVAGQLQSPGDVDDVQFAAKAQEVFWIEVFGHRDGSGADPYLTLEQIIADESGRETSAQLIATQDDIETNLFPEHFNTRSDDVSYRFVAPADGSYQISLRDRYFESRGDLSLIYRLSIRRERPDFRLVVVPFAPRGGENNNTAAPWPIGLRQGDNFAVRVLAFRRDGFDGPIAIEVAGLPPGVSCHPSSLEAGQVQATLVFSSAENASPAYAAIRVIGKAQIPSSEDAGTNPPTVREVTRTARSGTIVWEGDAQRPAQSRISRELGLCVMNERAPLQVTTDTPRFDVNRDQTIQLPVKLTKRNGFDNDVTLTLEGQPKEVQFETSPIAKGTTEGVQRIVVPPNAPPGTYTLLLRARAQVSYTRSTAVDKQNAATASAAQPQDLNVIVPALPIVLHIN